MLTASDQLLASGPVASDAESFTADGTAIVGIATDAAGGAIQTWRLDLNPRDLIRTGCAQANALEPVDRALLLGSLNGTTPATCPTVPPPSTASGP